MATPLALIVDDEPDIRELICITLARMGIDCIEAQTLAQASACLAAQSFDLCLTDMRLPDGSGMDVVRCVQAASASTPVAVITAHGNVELAVEALKAGAFDFVSKPVELKMLRTLVNSALRLDPHEVAPSDDIESRLIGDAPVMHDLRTRIRKLARSQAPVYISGESGVGKELVAQMIHANGPRSGARFVPVNCGAISRDLIESELFGHKKGSFTGAFADNLGLFQAANGGTLFLDEVAELPLPMQVKLLRAIQEKAVRPVGSNTEIPIDVRILSATHKDLGGLVQAEQFRQDLFYRVNVIELKVPPLRERSHDVERLAKYILGRTSDLEVTPELAPSALKALREYEFPGNVRELENVLERALTLCEGNVIDAFDLALPSTLKANSQVTGMAFGRETLDDYLAQVEIETIESAMFKADNNKTAAAGMLGLKLGALRYRMQKLSLE